MLKVWFKIFYRTSKKNWLYILVNVLGWALGFAGLLIVLLYLKDEESYNINNLNKDIVFRVLHKTSKGEIWTVNTDVEGAKYKEEIPEITSFYLSETWYRNDLVKVDEKEIFSERILYGNPNFFDFFSFKILEGSPQKFKEVRSNIAISKKQAIAFFGNASAIGKTVEFDTRVFKVAVVYEIIGKHYFMPNIIIQYEKPNEGSWNSFSKNLLLKTNKSTHIGNITKKLNNVWYKNAIIPEAKKEGLSPDVFFEKHGTTVQLESIKDIRLKTKTNDGGPEGKGNYQLILIMLSLSILLIIISCVNFINLSIASGSQRIKEVGVNTTLGLPKIAIINQFVLEVLIQGGVAFVLSLILVELLLPSFNSFMEKDISLFQINLLVKMAGLVLLISILIGRLLAAYMVKFKSFEILKRNVTRTKRGVFSKNIMLGIQFLISGFFLVGALVIYQQMNYITHKDLGFDGEQVIVVPINKFSGRYKKYLLAKNELIKHPNIEAITSNSFIIGGGSSSSSNVNYKSNTSNAYCNSLDYNYLDAMGINVIKGRKFDNLKASDTINNVLINESLAKALHIYDDPIGKQLSGGFGKEGEKWNVIGMVKDYHIYGMDIKIPPMLFAHWNTIDWMKNNFWMVQFKIKQHNVEETIHYIEKYWNEIIDPGYPFEWEFINKRYASTYEAYKKQQTLFFILTIVVILISLLGVFALATLTIQQRLKEVAIRKALGASANEIIFQLIKTFLNISLIASVALIPIAYYFIQNWLNNFVYRIEMPWWPYILTPLLLVFLIFIVVGMKAFKATKVDLIKYLKFE